jgi:hypothetical protein
MGKRLFAHIADICETSISQHPQPPFLADGGLEFGDSFGAISLWQ